VSIAEGSTGKLIGDGTRAGSYTIAFNGLDGISISGTGRGGEILVGTLPAPEDLR
jgi:hypothetical protein